MRLVVYNVQSTEGVVLKSVELEYTLTGSAFVEALERDKETLQKCSPDRVIVVHQVIDVG